MRRGVAGVTSVVEGEAAKLQTKARWWARTREVTVVAEMVVEVRAGYGRVRAGPALDGKSAAAR